MADNGVLFPGKSDVERLADSLNGDDENDSSSMLGTIPKQPTYSDINKYVKNLNMLVGTGFMLIHNDLEELIKLNKSSSGGDWKVALVAAIAAAIPGILEGVTDSLVSIVDSLGDNLRQSMDSLGDNIVKVVQAFKSDKNIDFILEDEELNQEILASEDIRELRKGYTKGYLKAYYSNLIANFGYEYDYKQDILTEKTSVGSVVSDVAGGLAGGLAQGITAVYDGIAQSMSSHELDDDAEVKAVRKLGYAAYLRAYYVNLMSPYGWEPDDINADTWKLVSKPYDLKQLLSDAGQALGSLVAGTIGPVLDSITNSIADATLNGDEGVKATRKAGYKAYLKAYYANMLEPFGWEPEDINADEWRLRSKPYDLKQLLSDAGQALGSLVAGSLEAITSSLTNSVAEGFLNTDEEVLALRKRGYMAYLKAYYHNLLEPYGYHVADVNSDDWSIIKNPNYSAKEFFKDLSDILAEFLKSGMNALAQSLTDGIANAVINGDEEVKETRRKGYRAYLRLYYKQIFEGFGYTIDDVNSDNFILRKGGLGEGWLRGKLKDFNSLFDISAFKYSPKIDDSNLNDETDVKETRKAGYKLLLGSLYDKMKDVVENIGKNNSTLRSYAFNMLESLSEAMKDSSFGEIQTTIVNEAKDYSDKLDRLINYVMDIKNSSNSLYNIESSVEEVSSSVNNISQSNGTYGAIPMSSSFNGAPSENK